MFIIRLGQVLAYFEEIFTAGFQNKSLLLPLQHFSASLSRYSWRRLTDCEDLSSRILMKWWREKIVNTLQFYFRFLFAYFWRKSKTTSDDTDIMITFDDIKRYRMTSDDIRGRQMTLDDITRHKMTTIAIINYHIQSDDMRWHEIT